MANHTHKWMGPHQVPGGYPARMQVTSHLSGHVFTCFFSPEDLTAETWEYRAPLEEGNSHLLRSIHFQVNLPLIFEKCAQWSRPGSASSPSSLMFGHLLGWHTSTYNQGTAVVFRIKGVNPPKGSFGHRTHRTWKPGGLEDEFTFCLR